MSCLGREKTELENLLILSFKGITIMLRVGGQGYWRQKTRLGSDD
jgi:hypothetical protein